MEKTMYPISTAVVSTSIPIPRYRVWSNINKEKLRQMAGIAHVQSVADAGCLIITIDERHDEVAVVAAILRAGALAAKGEYWNE